MARHRAATPISITPRQRRPPLASAVAAPILSHPFLGGSSRPSLAGSALTKAPPCHSAPTTQQRVLNSFVDQAAALALWYFPQLLPHLIVQHHIHTARHLCAQEMAIPLTRESYTSETLATGSALLNCGNTLRAFSCCPFPSRVFPEYTPSAGQHCFEPAFATPPVCSKLRALIVFPVPCRSARIESPTD